MNSVLLSAINYAGCLITWYSISSHSYIYIYLHLRYSLDWICSFAPTVRVRQNT